MVFGVCCPARTSFAWASSSLPRRSTRYSGPGGTMSRARPGPPQSRASIANRAGVASQQPSEQGAEGNVLHQGWVWPREQGAKGWATATLTPLTELGENSPKITFYVSYFQSVIFTPGLQPSQNFSNPPKGLYKSQIMLSCC